MIIIKPQNQSAFLEKHDRPSMTLFTCLCSLYQVRGTSVGVDPRSYLSMGVRCCITAVLYNPIMCMDYIGLA